MTGVGPEGDPEANRETDTARLRWRDPAWRAEVDAWILDQVARLGRRLIGPVDQPRIRPWSTALTVPTDRGRLWFKAGGPGSGYEAALLDALTGWSVPHVLLPVASEPARGWLLLPDGGSLLRDGLDGGPGLEDWLRILPEYAELQRAVAPRADDLVARGVPDLRPAGLPGRFEALVEDPAMELPAGDRARLRGLRPDVVRMAAELDAFGVGASVQHDDLHDGNVFVGRDGDRIFDWGDASVAHPFGTLLVTFRSIASRGLGDGDAERRDRALDRLRDAYLEPWTVDRPRSELAAAVPIAMRLAIVGRAASWHRALTGVPSADRGEWSGHPAGWLMELFEPSLV